MTACPKGPTRKALKARKKRAERKVVDAVRAACVLRDGYCRASTTTGAKGHWDDAYVGCPLIKYGCSGPSEWAHFGKHKRARTRGMAPELRHTTVGSLMLCRSHHQHYDAGRLRITTRDKRGCNGPLEFREVTDKG